MVDYTPEQQALLTPTDTPVTVPASRVLPDLGRFGYAPNRRLDDAREALKFTRMVAKVLEESPRLYSLAEIEPRLENSVVQYGPAADKEADAWYVARFDEQGFGTLEKAPLSEPSRKAFETGSKAYAAGDMPGARAAFEEAVEDSPGVPGLALALAETLAATGDPGAQAAFEKAVEIDPTFASAHRGLAALLLEKGETDRARQELAEALAYHPTSELGLALANEIHPGASTGEHRPAPFAIFLDVDAVGAIRVGAEPTSAAQLYAGCRAVMRYEPEVRSAIFEEPPETPYYLSVVEEVICLESGIGAYLFDVGKAAEDNQPLPTDPHVEALLAIAQADGLSGYAMFEILGRYRPERARTAPPDVHREVVAYVLDYVLGSPPDLPPGHYTASR
jgi:tetratricopeptide (TPR) repeat protein